jgi:hypothetical protein
VITKKQKKRGENISNSKYRILKWGVTGFMGLVFLYALNITDQIELSTELKLTHGWLIPGSNVAPVYDESCVSRVPAGALKIYLGTNLAWETKFPHTIVGVKTAKGTIEPKIIVDRNSKRQLAITMDVYNDKGDILAEIKDNFFTINPNNYFKISHPDGSLRSLSVQIPHEKQEVLNIRYINPTTVMVLGVFHFKVGMEPLILDPEGMRLDGHPPTAKGCFGNTGIADIVLDPFS